MSTDLINLIKHTSFLVLNFDTTSLDGETNTIQLKQQQQRTQNITKCYFYGYLFYNHSIFYP